MAKGLLRPVKSGWLAACVCVSVCGRWGVCVGHCQWQAISVQGRAEQALAYNVPAGCNINCFYRWALAGRVKGFCGDGRERKSTAGTTESLVKAILNGSDSRRHAQKYALNLQLSAACPTTPSRTWPGHCFDSISQQRQQWQRRQLPRHAAPNRAGQISLNHMIRQDSRFINAAKFD